MKVKQLNEKERPREKALLNGIKSLSNRELIALLLRSGTREKSALEVADELLCTFETMGDLGSASIHDVMHIKGIKEAKAVELLAAFEIGKLIALDDIQEKVQIGKPEDVVDWLQQEIGFCNQECFYVIFLNQKNQIQSYKQMFTGTLTNASVHPREIFKEAMRLGCARIMVAHNHPSGDPTPSNADIELTNHIVESGKMVAIPLMDHIIVARNAYISFRQMRLID